MSDYIPTKEQVRITEQYVYGYIPNMKEMQEMWMCIGKNAYGIPTDRYLRRVWKDWVAWLKKRECSKERERIIALLETHVHSAPWCEMCDWIALIKGEQK